ncbi:MAG TPA: aspartate/glutamate racemase family protein [Streptosporangiaceae bacterium]|nr:aspartate/glutamate racemase family protein [Streptosporangiaceae bacterium]
MRRSRGDPAGSGPAEAPASAQVAVIAGTPYDARLGADLLAARGIRSTPYPMASSPDEQDGLQYLAPDALNRAFQAQVRDIHALGSTVALLFCNSLSAVVDLDAIAETSPVRLISPITVYRRLPPDLERIMVLTGNGQATVGFERTVMRAAGDRRVLAVSDQALVRAIENGDPADAFASSHLPTTLRLAEHLDLDVVVLACTHFTAILPFVEAACSVPVIDVGTSLVALTCEAAGLAGPG